jgi:hypothetical protein
MGLNPEEILTKEASTKPNATVMGKIDLKTTKSIS